MKVELKIKNWKVELKDNASTPTVVGKYEVIMNGKSIAEQDFNDGYSSKDIPFSGDIIQKIVDVEKLIVSEIQKIMN